MTAPSSPTTACVFGPAAETVPDALARIRTHEPAIQAWAHTMPAPGGDGTGPLAGIPFGVKDVIDVADMPTRCGSLASDPRPAALDAACVSRLRRAGAVPLGKTVTAEYAFRAPGPTRNPHHPAHTPGGSSSGSAAAVAAGMVPFALGTQTGGSVIRPAAYCGVVGFKPSFGHVQRSGMTLTCDALDTIGWFADSVVRAAIVADILLPECGRAQDCARPPTIAVLTHIPSHPLDPSALAAIERARDRLQADGADVRDLGEWPHTARLGELHEIIMTYEISRNLQPVADRYPDRLSESLRQTIATGARVGGPAYRTALRDQAALRQDWGRLVGTDVDLILGPSAPGPAPAGLENTGNSACNKIWSLLGWPALHLPLTCTPEGLPIGVQFVAGHGEDHTLLAWGVALHPRLRD